MLGIWKGWYKKYYKLCGINLNTLNIDDVYKKSEGWISAIYLIMLNYIEYNTIEISEDIYELVEKLVYEPFEDKFKDFYLDYVYLISLRWSKLIYNWGWKYWFIDKGIDSG